MSKHVEGCPEDHGVGTKCRSERKNDGRLDIVITEEAFIFSTGSGQAVDHSQRQIGKGVVSLNSFGMSHVGELHFDRSKWEFEDVKDFLLDLGFRPSDQQNAAMQAESQLHVVEVTFEIESIEEVPLVDIGSLAYKERVRLESNGVPLLKVRAKAITAGTHKTFIFTRDVLKDAIPLYNGENIVLNHKFDDPSDVVGFIPEEDHAFMGDDGPIVDFYITKKGVMERVKSGELHSVSSNFMLTANDDKLVKKINKVMEVTLTGRPADPDATVEETTEVELQSQNLRQTSFGSLSQVPPFGSRALSATSCEHWVAETTNNTNGMVRLVRLDTTSTKDGVDTMTENENLEPPAPDGEAAKLQQTLDEMLTLEEQVTKLKTANAEKETQLTRQDERITSLEKDVDVGNEQARLQLAADQANELYRVKKIYPNQIPAAEGLYSSFTDEQRKMFHEFMAGYPQINVDFTDRGTPMTDQPHMAHPEEMLLREIALDKQADTQWKAYGFDGPLARQQVQQGFTQPRQQHTATVQMQPYPTGQPMPQYQPVPVQFQAPVQQPQLAPQPAPVHVPMQQPMYVQQPLQEAPQQPIQPQVGFNPTQPVPGGPGPLQGPAGFSQPMATGPEVGEPPMPDGIRSYNPNSDPPVAGVE